MAGRKLDKNTAIFGIGAALLVAAGVTFNGGDTAKAGTNAGSADTEIATTTPQIRTILTNANNERTFTDIVAKAFQNGSKVNVAKLAEQYGIDPNNEVYKSADALFTDSAAAPGQDIS